ncbi:FAD-binding protein [candidate division KSB1 bacterium]|nr:FAD-binding protein [candidate division KSB1 bacterium]
MASEHIARDLSGIVGERYLLRPGHDDFGKYEHDETEDLVFPPQFVVRPDTATEIQEVVRLAERRALPLVARGGGTGLSGGALATRGGIVLSLDRMNRIREIDEENFFVVCEPGVITQQLQEAVEARGLFYPPDPASRGSCTIGGNVAEGAGGPRALKYGVTRDYVYGVKVVTHGGELLTFGGKRYKDVTGYNMAQLFVGSEGTLGIVTEITLKLIALPKFRRTLLVPFDELVAAAAAVPAVMRTGVVPCAMEFMEQACLLAIQNHRGEKIPFSDRAAVLLIEVDGNSEAVLDSEMETISAVLDAAGAADIFLAGSPAQQTEIWAIRRAAGEAVKSICPYKEEDTVVPRSKLPALVKGVHEICDRWGLRVICYGHAGDGNVHCNILKFGVSDHVWEHELHDAVHEIFRLTVSLGGTVSGEHGIGHVQRRYLHLAMSPAEIEFQRSLKRALDPLNIFNPGKLLPE